MSLGIAMTGALIGLVGAYVITSFVLLKRPDILHRKRKRYIHAVHISHRGGAGERLENTFPAFERAISLSTDMLELDCHLLANGDVVVSHDKDLTRLTGVDADISGFTIHTLPPLLEKLQLTFAPDRYVVATTPAERKFTLLIDIFKAFPTTAINIDIKVDNDELIRKVNELVCLFNREHLTVWGNRNNVINMKCFHANKNIGTLFSQRRIIETVVLFYTGLLPFLPIRESYFEIPMLKILLQPEFGNFMTLSNTRRFVIWLFDKLLMRPALIKHLRDRGIPTFVWVCNTEKNFREAFEAGAVGVMTDYPTLLRRFLNDNPKFANYPNENDNLIKANGDYSCLKKILK